MKRTRSLLRLLIAGFSMTLFFSLTGQAAQAPSLRTLPQMVDPPFVFEGPLPASRPVSTDWFSDAVFIGDVRSEELIAAGLFQPGLSLAQMGLNIRDVRSGDVFTLNGQRATLGQMLDGAGCQKVYLMLGFNEASWMGEQDFYEEYSALIDDLRQYLPAAQIYVQTLIPVTVSRAAARTPDNALLASRSALLSRLAQDKQVYLVAVGTYFTEPNGALSPDLSTDGLHLTAEGNAQWFQYLRTHTMGT